MIGAPYEKNGAAEPRTGSSRSDLSGCVVRFRPIMMTTMAALMGTMPIALGWGAGASARRGLGLAVVGGLIVSQVLTLYLTPVVYLYFERFQEWFGRTRGVHKEPSRTPASISQA